MLQPFEYSFILFRLGTPGGQGESEQSEASSPPPVSSTGRLKRKPARASRLVLYFLICSVNEIDTRLEYSVASSVPGEQEILWNPAPESHEPATTDGDQGGQEVTGQEHVNQAPAEESQGNDGRLSTPAPESSVSQAEEPQTPSYSASPVTEKRRRMQELAELRRKKPRL